MLLVSEINAQVKRWYQLETNDYKTTFIDTTTIRETDGQLSVWVLDIYKEPVEIENIDGMVKRARTQYLFDIRQLTYSEIGNLYYDDVGKIISQSYTPQIGGNARTFYQPLGGDEDASAVFNKLVELLNIEVNTSNSPVNYDPAIARRIEEANKDVVENLQSGLSETLKQQQIESSVDSADERNTGENITGEIDSENRMIIDHSENSDTQLNDEADIKSIAKIIDPITGNFIELKNNDRGTDNNISETQAEDSDDVELTYNPANERNVTNTIFTDGNLYCFQVSSWKRITIAEKEVERLKRSKHNAFIVEARPKHKQGVWYRVRVGYFNTLQEAKDYQKRVK
ncbi:MAG: SPOR domain-containing protein [Melioribacteraceae bacterium]|nr:SPOR domain-containing protein [Melioribacteraceae bacterium]